MYHIKLARDRRKKKRIKFVIFSGAIFSILLGVLLTFNDTSDESLPKNDHVFETEYHPLDSSHVNSTLSHSNNLNEDDMSSDNKDRIIQETDNKNTTLSYDDLDNKDDEVDQVDLGLSDNGQELPEEANKVLDELLDVADQALRIREQFSYTVVNGDSFSDVLQQSGLLKEVSDDLLKQYSELANIKPGQQFYWILDRDGNLEYLNWLVSLKEERIYERESEVKFKRLILEKETIWKKEILKGKINGSLSQSLSSLGLNSRQIAQLTKALQWQFNMRNLRKGDKFAISVNREYLDNKLTGQGNVEAIHIKTGGKNYYAVQANNGRYYNKQGETLGKTFSRYPLLRAARVSSPFNPRRRHPVTGRVRPHNGVDLSVSSGTPIIAPSDGTVEKVAYQANGAGRYVVLRHGREYQTVYMHLSRALVKAGQSVKKGQRIALSGNTGRSTGPHLHYEFRINGRPVNPLTVKLPGSSSQMGTKERKDFLVRAKEAEKSLKL
ncbi:murein DD-endopeptidase MepM/ murein hydrolase activator NlpD [Bisgaardia hudsonensis]|uniref:Murein DD-endopeptidase MepM/ murein hydrolase activator NlpD n=1 Tax=Bisgaardia hudsonensis TaxID=109472 RepID=A0A4R2N1S6_9PAST|nr:murein DD-endopeptidase MepM [Bisgaardia hudsonensis]QLB12935.1 peptidase M23 [Bisgaardia hudsonensis]TCP13504.1 murein DD-endopeptidase MepM/ murein hydrolase activator NlpD [Bisgaardia hudsonensis]